MKGHAETFVEDGDAEVHNNVQLCIRVVLNY